MKQAYDLQEHSHRFAAWAAATGASASPRCRFSVKTGMAILEAAGFDVGLHTPSELPSPRKLVAVHRKWRLQVIHEARKRKLSFTHGIAAKLINLYLKVRFTLAGHAHHPNVKAMHPPIDSGLLKSVNASLPRPKRLRTAWSTFDDDTYRKTIETLRELNGRNALWKIESHWTGHR